MANKADSVCLLSDVGCLSVMQEVARRSVIKTQLDVENGEEEEEEEQTVSILFLLVSIFNENFLYVE